MPAVPATAGGDVVTGHSTWAAGYTAGQTRGRRDAATEQAGTYTRPGPHDDEPPTLPAAQRRQWVAGFMDGYADGRQALGGAA